MIGAGDLDQCITIQNPVETIADDGARLTEWQDVAKVWAKIDLWKGKKEVQDIQETATVIYRVTIRRGITVTADMRIRWDSQGSAIMNIIQAPLPGRNPYIELLGETGRGTENG